ncbi:MAG: hypothetical protein M3256_04405 [Actinomycetota bacterium]|nr:hypothetical protein [Candidatus Dormibacteraeota bacterium]MDQ6945512.1 hypothetical protein [Actinomycetota bacterium]
MNHEPAELARNEWGVILQHEQWQTLELKWLPTTQDMTDDGFKVSLELLAGAGERVRPRFMLIDATDFHHQFGEGVMAWRDEHIIPRYNATGVNRFAFLVPDGSPGTVESGVAPAVDGPANFPTGWFVSRERAYQWLAE